MKENILLLAEVPGVARVNKRISNTLNNFILL